MRTNLKCPYEEKDEAKRLGARWDATRKTWYIENVEDLTPFMRWIKTTTHHWTPGQSKQAPKVRKPERPSITGAEAPEHCGCDALPWDDCIHTAGPAIACLAPAQ